MKISYNWLRQFIAFNTDPSEIGQMLTDCGLEVEQITPWESLRGGLEGIVIGKVVSCERHPNADRLSVTKVDTGDSELRQIVCGAPNVAAGQTVVVALPGAMLYPESGEPLEIRKSKIRGEVSEGMICAEDEIGLGVSHAGIMVLPDHLKAGDKASTYFHVERDSVFEIGLTPNRADAASHLGVARDILALLSRNGKATLVLPDSIALQDAGGEGRIAVDVEWKEACIRYSGIELKGIKPGPSPDWMQNRLRAVGLRPINNVVDVTNYVMLELGQPLHAFDTEKIRGRRIRVGKLPAQTSFTTLDGVNRTLLGHELMINDAEGGMCIAGVFGGESSGVSDTTSSVFIESACFHPVYVRKSARAHGLHTDSSFRFERGTDPRMTIRALERAVFLLKEIAGAEINSVLTDVYPSPVNDRIIPLSLPRLTSLLGATVPRQEVKSILENLGMQVKESGDDLFEVAVPPFKVDVTRPADLAEEVLRIYGYNSIGLPKKIIISTGRINRPDPEELTERMGSFLVAQGFREILNNSLTREAYSVLLPTDEGSIPVALLNPLSADLANMRHSMLPAGLESIVYNINRKRKDLRFFEWGKTYLQQGSAYHERQMLAIWLSGEMHGPHWQHKAAGYDVYFLKAIVENLLLSLPLSNGIIRKLESFTSNALEQSFRILFGNDTVATAGCVQRKLLSSFDIQQPVWYAELDMDMVFKHCSPVSREIAGPPRFPEVRRDLSMLLDRHVQYAQLEEIAYATEPGLLKQVNLFDVYEGEKIEQGKKSYALSFTLRDDEATLQDKRIESVMEKLMKAFETRLGAIIRKG
jgi:phenylalanyl-tRNA synthetase beta chain